MTARPFFYYCYWALALALSWCSAASQRPTTPPRPAAATGPVVPVAILIRQLLDTARATSGSPAGRAGTLQAGPEVRDLYGTAYEPVWTAAGDTFTAEATAALGLLSRAAAYGLRPADYEVELLGRRRDSLLRPAGRQQRPGQRARLDVYLSDAVLHFMRDVSRGRLRPAAVPPRLQAAGADQPVAGLRRALAQGDVPAAMLAGQPANREYRRLQQALADWLILPVPPDSLAQHQARYEQACLTLERWRWEAWPPDEEYLLINLPAYELQVVAHDSVVRRHRVIVGKPQTPTPTLNSTITSFTLAPDWHVPRSIAIREMLPRLQEDAGYLALNNLALYDSRGRPLDPRRINWARVTPAGFAYSIRQSAGCENALGNVVFRFANPYAVYLHDTPMRQFFDQPVRAFSHGCIRLAEPLALAAYLLRREGRPDRLPDAAACARLPQPREVRLRRPLALHVCYATCVADSSGRLRFLADIYGRDEPLRQALFGGRP